MTVTQLFSEFMVEDLRKSGLELKDINARPLGPNERHATGAPQTCDGYVIPYYDIGGKPLPFYRARVQNWDPKYRQLVNEPNHIYFPKGFWDEANDADYIILTEGEKKAACATKHHFACVGVGGVDSWSNKTITLPKETRLSKAPDGRLIAKLTAGDEINTQQDEMATGMMELVELLVRKDIPLVIIYDSDESGRVPSQVQAAAARLGYSLRFHGVKAKNIRQFIIKPPRGFFGEKLGLDDLLVSTKVTAHALDIAIRKVLAKPSAFPSHPNPREYVNKKLRRSKMSREQLQGLATSILCDLDSQGSRLYSSSEEELYYFSRQTRQLMRANFKFNEQFSKSDFGVHLYRHYNLSISDERVLTWLGTLYAGEEPISSVEPERVIAVRDDAIYYQISSAQMIKVTSGEIRVLDNGSDDILFLSDSVEDMDKGKLVAEINRLMIEEGDDGEVAPLPNYWLDVAMRTRIQDDDSHRAAKILSYLYSISPWFYRWKGTQLPVEMMIGEPGSGKSTLYELRLNIMNGRPRLRNPAKDINDWGVSVGGTGGLHVTDNVNMQDGKLRQQISDEMCRLITEPKPSIEKRKLYTDNDTVDIPVKTVFAITAIRQPFNAADIIQRSIITPMHKGSEAVEYAGDWAKEQLELFGGREGWMAQQLVFIHRLLQLTEKKWVSRYPAKYRLTNVEQLLKLAAELYGDPENGSWITGYLEGTQAEKIAEGDTVLGALRKFAETVIDKYGEYNKGKRFTAKDLALWMSEQDEYENIEMLTNSRMIGRYMKNNPNLLATVAGITEHGTSSNASAYVAHLPKT